MICKTSKRARKSTSASVDRPNERGEKWSSSMSERRVDSSSSAMSGVSHLWITSRSDDENCMRAQVYVRWLWHIIKSRNVCFSRFSTPEQRPDRALNGTICWIFSHFSGTLPAPQKRAFSFSSSSIIPFSMIFSLFPLLPSFDIIVSTRRAHSFEWRGKLNNEHDDDATVLYTFEGVRLRESERRSLWLWIKFRFCSFFSSSAICEKLSLVIAAAPTWCVWVRSGIARAPLIEWQGKCSRKVGKTMTMKNSLDHRPQC